MKCCLLYVIGLKPRQILEDILQWNRCTPQENERLEVPNLRQIQNYCDRLYKKTEDNEDSNADDDDGNDDAFDDLERGDEEGEVEEEVEVEDEEA